MGSVHLSRGMRSNALGDRLLCAPADDAELDEETVDAIFESLSDGRRRRLLCALREAGGPLSVDGLARRLEREAPSGAEASQEDVRIGLVHVHLPKLSDCGLVSLSENRAAVDLTARGAAVAERLSA